MILSFYVRQDHHKYLKATGWDILLVKKSEFEFTFFELHTDTSFCKFSVFGNDLVRMKFCACYSQAYGFITF